ncbi:recombinase, partial [Aliarcobacter skirrowii]|uniref:site-specific recombinase n=1 Tax=Aliarcobacter skirrowii TaxID=28200 RepID=UPI001026E418
QNSKKNSLIDLYKQGIKIVARSVTNYTSEHGEHYIATDLKAYFKMFLSAAGAGIIIAIMALIKINITQAGFSIGTLTFLSSLNYGLGFVFIHILGFTVATKQPAMTASKLAQEIEEDENNKANQKKIIDLIFQVSRSQFSAIAGNVILAISVAFLISYLAIKNGYIILDDEDIKYYLKNLEPNIALFYAAIAGVWLFLSGLISGYFDNRADLLELKDRYYHQPLLKKLISDKYREKFATYLHEHYGSILGNFFFGILLGITPFIGYLLNLPLDISHVAFSSAYLGYTSMHFDISITLFIYYLVCVLLIGFVNLIVSFTLALKVSLLSRDTKFGNFFSFIKNLIIEICKKPHKLFFPFTYKNKK